ncbi:unnamed protein product [Amoebophrya sp. A25]|nr:unnamed protein product [Amoebophrya sp. A25]|eukprot:GSA25T00013895001.1
MIPGKVEVPSISSEEALNRPTRSSSTSTWSSDSATQSLPGIRGRIFRRDSVSEAMDTNSNDDAHAASDEPQNWKQDLVQQIRDTCKNGGCCPSTLSCCIGRSSACSNTKASVTSL